jgi:dienelactone hydrolase
MKLPILFLFLLIAATARRYESVTFTHEGLQVAARLSLPDGAGPFRAIVIVPGSGANDKDGTIPMYGANVSCMYPGLLGDTLRPYKGLSDALTDSGYAVLTYDKLEYTYPTGLGTITFRKLWLPAASGIAYLRSRTDIRGNDLVLLGHSEGASLIPHLARQDAGITALINLAGARRSIYDTLLAYQVLQITRTCGGDTAAAKVQGAQFIAYFNLIRSGRWNSSTPPFAGVSAAVWSDYLKVTDSVVFNYNAFTKPRLFIGLEDDMNVPVATELARFRIEITGGAHFVELPGLNHYLSTATDPAVSKLLTDTIVAWLRREAPALSIPEVSTGAGNAFRLLRQGADWRLESGADQIRQVTLFDSNGRNVYSSAASGNTFLIHLPNLPAGIYSLQVRGAKSSAALRLNL